MSKSRSVSRSVPAERTISVDPIYAQELIEFWMQKYEQVKEELDYTRDTSVAAPSSSPGSSRNEDDEERGKESSPATECEAESEVQALKACNEELEKQLAAGEQKYLDLLEGMQAFNAQNKSLANEADMWRQQKIQNSYPSPSFLPAGWTSTIFRVSSQVLSERVPADVLGGRPICFLSRPPACLPLRVNKCGQHGYWFSPVTTYPENTEFELVVEGEPVTWTYLGRYKSIHLTDGEMRLSEWLLLNEEIKVDHCISVVSRRPGQDPSVTPEAVFAAVTELRRGYESGKEAIPCFALVCTGFTPQVHTALATARIGKRESDAQLEAGGKRFKRETNSN